MLINTRLFLIICYRTSSRAQIRKNRGLNSKHLMLKALRFNQPENQAFFNKNDRFFYLKSNLLAPQTMLSAMTTTIFHIARGHLLHCKRPPLAFQQVTYRNTRRGKTHHGNKKTAPFFLFYTKTKC